MAGSWIKCKNEILSFIDEAQFDEISYLESNPDVALSVQDGNFASGYAHWLAAGQQDRRRGSGLSLFRNRRPGALQRTDRPTLVHFYGPLSAKSGLGVAAKGYAEVLSQSGIELATFDTTHVFLRQEPPLAIEADRKPDVVIIHHNADTVEAFFEYYPIDILDDVYTIGIWVWELAAFRQEWIGLFAAFDEIWTPSNFCAEAIRARAPNDVVVRVVPHAVKNSTVGTFDRSHFGLPDDAFVFNYSFDVSSVLQRKNPHALIAAFKREFGDDRSVILSLKYHSGQDYFQELRELRRLCYGSNIVHFEGFMRPDEVSSLKRVSDAFASPHRSEGFGINIAEAMLAAKPVIATAYSGNMDFTHQDNSFLLNYRLTEIDEGNLHYPASFVWAEPDVEHLGRLLREVKSSADEAKNRANRAQGALADALSAGTIARSVSRYLNDRGSQFSSPTQRTQSVVRKSGYTWRHHLSLTEQNSSKSYFPLISVIVPVYNIDPLYLRACVQSVIDQTYHNWELILCDDRSTEATTVAYLHSLSALDQRIKIRWLERNLGISGSSNAAVEMACGEFVAFLDNDDTLHPEALEAYADEVRNYPDVDFIYCDEDKIDVHGNRVDHYLKPDWSPEHLESCMYVLHMLFVRKKLFLELGGFREEFAGAQDYDLALRISLNNAHVRHIPRVLYHWRMIPGSAAEKVDAKPVGLQRAKLAVVDYAKAKCGGDATVEDGLLPGTFRVRRGVRFHPPVTLVITTSNVSKDILNRGEINLLSNLLSSVAERTNYKNFKIIVASNGAIDSAADRTLRSFGGTEIVYRGSQERFNFSDKANFAIGAADTEFVVLMNDDMEIRSADWLQALLDHIQTGDVGAVGARLLFPNDHLQHIGVAIGVNEGTAHLYHGHPADLVGYNGFPNIVRNYSAVTGACMATKRSLFDRVGGFDPAFATDFNDTDYCLKLQEAGYRIVYTPYCDLYHFESQTAVRQSQSPAEVAFFRKRWAKYFENDPFFNRNLNKNSIIFEADPVWAAAQGYPEVQ